MLLFAFYMMVVRGFEEIVHDGPQWPLNKVNQNHVSDMLFKRNVCNTEAQHT